MLLTNEPGIYREGEYGIRTENVLLVVEDEKTEFGQFLKFETISYCPVDIRGIDSALLTKKEREWINAYHKEVYSILSPFLTDGERDWLGEMTQPL